MKISKEQKQMIADMLDRTETSKDIEINSGKILGNAYGDKKTEKAYRECAILKVAMVKSRK